MHVSIRDIVKKVRQEDTYRRMTSEFGGVGMPTGHEGEIWAFAPGVPIPPAVEQNSEPYDEPIYAPPKIRWDADAHAAYQRKNTPRVEPAAPVLLTEADIKRKHRWTDEQWKLAVANGYPSASGYREQLNDQGLPAGRVNLWRLEADEQWEQAHAMLRGGR